MSLFNKGFKPLKTPSYILRIFTIIFFLFAVLCLSMPFFTMQLQVETSLDHKMTQTEVDQTTQQLKTAMDSLVKKETDKDTETEDTTLAMDTMQREWIYTNIEDNADITKFTETLDQCMSVNGNLYTEESYKALKDEILSAQEKAGTYVKISQTALQMIFCGNIAQQYIDPEANTAGGLVYILFILFPALGFFINAFDSKRHIKNVATLLTSSAAMILILILVSTSCLDIGSLLSIFAYMLLLILGIGSIYAKQQEDYIVNHPELEAEFTEKHPQFVKALLNEKRFNVILSSEREKEKAEGQKPKSKKETTKDDKSKTKKKK